jgi:heptosyltransferase-2
MINRILILRFRSVGDSVVSVVLCSTLRATFPGATIDYVLNDKIAPLFEGHPDIDRLITFSKEELASMRTYLAKLSRVTREGRYDLIIDTRVNLRSLWFALFSMRTPLRVGIKKSYNILLHNRRVDINVPGADEVTRMSRLLSPLEKVAEVRYEREFKLYLLPGEKEAFRRVMEEHGVDFVRPVIVCAVATQIPFKAWDMERMKELLARVIEYRDAQLVFNHAGPVEENTARELHREMNNHPNVFSNIHARTLRELAAMIANSDFFFGNEGGPRHVSQAFDIPSFAIYPPHISKTKWLPNACDRYQGLHPTDISARASSKQLSYAEQYAFITVDEVWRRLSPMLDKYLPRH